MKIAVIGWGSLIWCPRELAVQSKWHTDGPCLPVEFARKSGGMRVTLVLLPGTDPSRTYWALSTEDSLEKAAGNLRLREGMKSCKQIHAATKDPSSVFSVGGGVKPDADVAKTILDWLAGREDLDAAIWTGLGPKEFSTRGDIPLEQQVVVFLRGLGHSDEQRAKEYIQYAPASIDTPVRRAIEKGLQWKRQELPASLFEEAEEPGDC